MARILDLCNRRAGNNHLQKASGKKITTRLIFESDRIDKKSTDRSIKDDFGDILGRMTEKGTQWWVGLGKDLETDIESIDDASH